MSVATMAASRRSVEAVSISAPSEGRVVAARWQAPVRLVDHPAGRTVDQLESYHDRARSSFCVETRRDGGLQPRPTTSICAIGERSKGDGRSFMLPTP